MKQETLIRIAKAAAAVFASVVFAFVSVSIIVALDYLFPRVALWVVLGICLVGLFASYYHDFKNEDETENKPEPEPLPKYGIIVDGEVKYIGAEQEGFDAEKICPKCALRDLCSKFTSGDADPLCNIHNDEKYVQYMRVATRKEMDDFLKS